MESLIFFAKFFSYTSVIFPIGFYLVVRKYDNNVINIFAALLASSLLSDTICIILLEQRVSTVRILNLFDFIQLIFVTLIYKNLYLRDRKIHNILFSVFAVIYILANVLIWQDLKTYQNVNWILSSLMIIAMAFGHFNHMAKYPVIKINEYGPFWISTGLLFYSTFTFAIFAFSNVLVEFLKVEDFRVVWMFHNLNNIFKNACFFMAVWWTARRDPAYDTASPYEN